MTATIGPTMSTSSNGPTSTPSTLHHADMAAPVLPAHSRQAGRARWSGEAH